MSNDLQAKKAAIRRIFERFNESQTKIRIVFNNGSIIIYSNINYVLLSLPEYALLDPKVFETVHSFIINKLKEGNNV